MSDSGTVNLVTILGNVGRDPEIRNLQGGDKIANFSVATSQQWKDRASGEKRELTEWHKISVFNQHLVGVVEKYVKKGSRLYIEGKVQTRKWTKNDGEDVYTTEIVLPKFGGVLQLEGGGRQEGGSPDRGETRAPAQRRASPAPAGGSTGAGWETDEIPFAACWQ